MLATRIAATAARQARVAIPRASIPAIAVRNFNIGAPKPDFLEPLDKNWYPKFDDVTDPRMVRPGTPVQPYMAATSIERCTDGHWV